MNLKIFQTYYNTETRKLVEDCAIAYDNSLNLDSELYENGILVNLYRLGAFWNSDYCGLVGTRLEEKTGKTLQQFIDEMKEDKFSNDIYILCAYQGEEAINFWANTFEASRKIAARLNNEYPSLLGFSLTNNNWVNCYCNYAVMRPEILGEYVSLVLEPLINFLKTTEDRKLKQYLSTKVEHRGKMVSILPFFLEGLMGSFIADRNYSFSILSKPNPYESK